MAFCKALLPTCKCIYRVWLLAAVWDAEGISHVQTDNSAECKEICVAGGPVCCGKQWTPFVWDSSPCLSRGRSAGWSKGITGRQAVFITCFFSWTCSSFASCPSIRGMLYGTGACEAARGSLELSRPLQDILSYLGKDLELPHAYLNGSVNLLSLWTLPGPFFGAPSGVSLKGAAQTWIFMYFLIFLLSLAQFCIWERVGFTKESAVMSTDRCIRYIPAVKNLCGN